MQQVRFKFNSGKGEHYIMFISPASYVIKNVICNHSTLNFNLIFKSSYIPDLANTIELP